MTSQGSSQAKAAISLRKLSENAYTLSMYFAEFASVLERLSASMNPLYQFLKMIPMFDPKAYAKWYYRNKRNTDPEWVEKQRERSRVYQKVNREKMSKRSTEFANRRRERISIIINEFKSGRYCMDCHIDSRYVYDPDKDSVVCRPYPLNCKELVKVGTDEFVPVPFSKLHRDGTSLAEVREMLAIGEVGVVCLNCFEIRKRGL